MKYQLPKFSQILIYSDHLIKEARQINNFKVALLIETQFLKYEGTSLRKSQ